MFEDYKYTYEGLMEDAMSRAPDGIDTREGSIYWDAISGNALMIARAYANMDIVLSQILLDSCTGDALDDKASEHGLSRHQPTAAQYQFSYTGTQPNAGERFYYDGSYFTLRQSDDGTLYLLAEQTGSGMNSIKEGTPAIPVNTIDGLTSATFGEILKNGTDLEDDDEFRKRVQEKIGGPAENGNKQHYKTWCEAMDGVGLARIFPLWAGPNTVKAVLIDPLGEPCGPEVVAQCQEKIDPMTLNETVTVDGVQYPCGDGLGEGLANIGAHLTVKAADKVAVNISFKAVCKSGYTTSNVADEAKTALTKYFRSLVLTNDDPADVVVRAVKVGAILTDMDSLQDYSDLLLNGKSTNILLGDDGVPMIGEVTVT